MGGDDLGSEDEYLFDAGFVDSSAQRGTAVDSDDEGSISGDDGIAPSSLVTASSKKRKGAADNNDDDDIVVSKKKRKKKEKAPTNSKNLLIQAGRGIAMDSAVVQATFLGTIYSHSIKMSGGGAAAQAKKDVDEEAEGESKVDNAAAATTITAASTSFSFQEHVFSPPKEINDETRKFQHNNLAAFLKSGALPSNKRLKNWKHPHSPMVLIVTLSARRSVELMKQLSSLKLPIAKLFAKHMPIEDQVTLLKGVGMSGGGGGGGGGGSKKARRYSLAVGTPGRLLKLLRHGRDGPDGDGLGALRLKHTELIIIDCHEDSKGWTVCTLKDTMPELMEFMKEGVVPELEKRKGKIKLAMF